MRRRRTLTATLACPRPARDQPGGHRRRDPIYLARCLVSRALRMSRAVFCACICYNRMRGYVIVGCFLLCRIREADNHGRPDCRGRLAGRDLRGAAVRIRSAATRIVCGRQRRQSWACFWLARHPEECSGQAHARVVSRARLLGSASSTTTCLHVRLHHESAFALCVDERVRRRHHQPPPRLPPRLLPPPPQPPAPRGDRPPRPPRRATRLQSSTWTRYSAGRPVRRAARARAPRRSRTSRCA